MVQKGGSCQDSWGVLGVVVVCEWDPFRRRVEGGVVLACDTGRGGSISVVMETDQRVSK